MVNWRAPLLDSKKDISTVMRLNNIRQATIDDILTDIRNGTNQRPNFSEHDGVLHFTDRQGRREVVALESRDAVMQELYEQHGIGMSIGRFHTLISRDYCNISRHKVEDWYANSESHQIIYFVIRCYSYGALSARVTGEARHIARPGYPGYSSYVQLGKCTCAIQAIRAIRATRACR